MTSSIISPSGVAVKVFPYEDFQGIDTSRDRAALDTGEKQHLISIVNGYADWRGAILRDPGAIKRDSSNSIIQHVDFFGRDLACWAQKDGGGVSLVSDRFFSIGAGHKKDEIYPSNAVVTSTVFNHKTIFATGGEPMYQYDGSTWQEIVNTNPATPAFVVTVQQRLATANSESTVVDISRVDETVFTADEDPASTSVTRAGSIDVRNIIGTADTIQGLGAFEQNRIAVFTRDRTLIYTIDPDLTKWVIDDKANVRYGTISHNTIAQAGSDLIFCSRNGVYSIRRSDTNGVTLFSIPMSTKVELTYRALLKTISNKQSVSAYYTQDTGQYHIFFPQTDRLSKRLTLTLDPTGSGNHKWSTGDFLSARCGSQLGETTLIGTSGGVWNQQQVEDVTLTAPTLVIETPILWQGAINGIKDSHSLIVQASGQGTIQVEAFDEVDRSLSTMFFEIDGGGEDDSFADVPLSRQYERKFEHRYRGVYFRFTLKGNGLLRTTGFAVAIRKK